MESSIQSFLALENLQSSNPESYLVYSYLLNEDPKPDQAKGYFIPIAIESNQKKANKKAKQIIELTGHKDIWTYPFAKWISLGDPNAEKVTPVEIRKGLEEINNKEEEKNLKLREERKRIEGEIRKEQEAIQDANTIEAYYYDWFCLVQNKSRRDMLREELKQAEEVYAMRVKNIREKNEKHPEYKDSWQDLLLARMKRRGEEKEAAYIIQGANVIAEVENL